MREEQPKIDSEAVAWPGNLKTPKSAPSEYYFPIQKCELDYVRIKKLWHKLQTAGLLL